MTARSPAGTPDPTGLAAARAVRQANPGDAVILFGSRARGDHSSQSDVDLVIVCRGGTIAAESRARRAIGEHFRKNPPALRVDIIALTEENFSYCRRAPNHVAGQALRDGIVMSGEKLDYESEYEDEYPASWPDVKERLQATHRNIRVFELSFETIPEDQETWGFHAQQAVENSVKARLSAAGIEYKRIHPLEEPVEKIFQHPVESQTLAAAQLRILLESAAYPDPQKPEETINWLTRYAALYRYSGTGHRMDTDEAQIFRREILISAHTFINRAHEITGTGPEDLG